MIQLIPLWVILGAGIPTSNGLVEPKSKPLPPPPPPLPAVVTGRKARASWFLDINAELPSLSFSSDDIDCEGIVDEPRSFLAVVLPEMSEGRAIVLKSPTGYELHRR